MPWLTLLAVSMYFSVRYPSLPLPRRYLYQSGLMGLIVVGAVAAAFFAWREGRPIASRLLLIGSGLLALLILGDLYVLCFRYDSSGPGGNVSVTHLNWYRRYVQNNTQGYWEDDLTPYMSAHAGGPVIAAVGDSFTWGQGLAGRNLRFTDRLERMLREHGKPSARVLNFGKGGTGTTLQNEQVIPDVGKVHPDVVLLFYLFNDLEDELGLVKINPSIFTPAERGWLAATPTFNVLFWRFVAPSRLGVTAAEMTIAWATNYNDDQSFGDHVAELGRMMSSIRAMGARPGIVILPYPHMWQNVTEKFRDRIYARLTTAIHGLDVPVLSLRSVEDRFPVGMFEVNPIDSHPGPAVHRAIAGETYQWLVDAHLLERP